MDRLLTFVSELKRAKIHFSLEHNREESIMVLIAVPGERWEVEFLKEGAIFKSQ